jgi:poly(3-hydroxybutyrate) depolymerase
MRQEFWLALLVPGYLVAASCGGRVDVPSSATTPSAASSAPVALDGAAGLGGSGGSGGSAGSAGLGGSGGADPAARSLDADLVSRSSGCGRPPPSGQLSAKYTQYTTHVTGRTLDPSFSVPPHDRDYFVWLPSDYDSAKAYRVTFLYMGCGNRSAADVSTYKLMSRDPESIYVAMDMTPLSVNVNGVDVLLPPVGKDCYDNTIGKQSIEWEFMALTASLVQQSFCVDENRLYVAGYSSGAWVANMMGCYFAGPNPARQFGKDISVRGQMSVSGGPVLPDVPCGGKVAALWIHDLDDEENAIAGDAQTSLPRVLAANGCSGGASGPQAPWGSTPNESSICQQFTACPAAYPVVFCTTSGLGHSSEDPVAIPAFIEFENLMNAQ